MFSKRIRPFFQGGIINILMIFGVIGIGAIMYGLKYDMAILVLGVIILIITGSSLTGFYGILIDYEEKKYKQYLSFLGIKIGTWHRLPQLEKIILTPKKHFIRDSSIKSDMYHEIFLIKLIPVDHGEAIVASMGLYGDLLIEADTLSNNLEVPIAENRL